METKSIKRRGIIKSLLAGSAFALISGRSGKSEAAPTRLKGRIKQCVCRGFWGKYPWDEFLPAVKQMGIVGIDLVGQNDWAKLKEYGMISSMSPGAGSIKNGINNPDL
ncbi:hydroxypyruvate isomerase, partial [bacterium]|nr:hydroxypyruvate isomerase [bacterium]